MKKVLVIEDDISLIEAIQTILEDEGYEVATLTTGYDVINAVNRFKPDVVLMDINLPMHTGDVLARKIKRSKKTQEVPIILISSVEDLARRAEIAGADGYISKPFNMINLINTTERVVSDS